MVITPQVDYSVTLPMTASGNTTAIDTLYYSSATLQLNCTSVTGTATSSTLQMQQSNDGATWQNVGSAISVNATGTFTGFGDPNTSGVFNWRYLRVAFTVGNITGGTLTVNVCLKNAYKL